MIKAATLPGFFKNQYGLVDKTVLIHEIRKTTLLDFFLNFMSGLAKGFQMSFFWFRHTFVKQILSTA